MQAMLYATARKQPQKGYNQESSMIKSVFQKNHPDTIKEEIMEGVKETGQEANERY